jgi:hypothetical protein
MQELVRQENLRLIAEVSLRLDAARIARMVLEIALGEQTSDGRLFVWRIMVL